MFDYIKKNLWKDQANTRMDFLQPYATLLQPLS